MAGKVFVIGLAGSCTCIIILVTSIIQMGVRVRMGIDYI